MKEMRTVKEILNNDISGLLMINPMKLNERLNIQQGLFCIPTNVNISFMDNLKNIIDNKSDIENIQKIKLILNKSFLKQIYYELHRMNINRSTLFPGIDGFSKYLKSLIPLGEGFLAIDKLKYE